MRLTVLFIPLIILLLILLLLHVAPSILDAVKAAITQFCNQTDEGSVADTTLTMTETGACVHGSHNSAQNQTVRIC